MNAPPLFPRSPRQGRADAIRALGEQADQMFQGGLSRLTLGLTPAGLTETYIAWLAHLALCPGRLAELAAFGWLHGHDDFSAREHARDSRFRSPLWRGAPWGYYVHAFRMAEAFWDRATLDIPGLTPTHERGINFTAHQILNAISPANFFVSNPEIQAAALRSCGRSLIQGAQHAYEDWRSQMNGEPRAGLDAFKPGERVALTPGKVVLRNDLIELIQYDPQTPQVHKEPILILPAWIMKYYILDLSPDNSLVAWLVRQGHTVFMASWKNPDSADRDKGMDDYVREGALAALNAVSAIRPKANIHLVGYCLGGTLALVTAAWLAQHGDERLRSLSLFAAQGDFTEAGEIMVFVTDSEVAYLKNMMRAQGYLDTRQMSGAFQMLRSNDSIWSHLVRDYWEGERAEIFDLLAWNADTTRLPYRMHSEYLEKLILENQFANGHYRVLGTPVAAETIRQPVFAVGTESDHVAPWTSVYKIHLMVSGNVTFVLTNGGHNAGIVSEPGHPNRHYWLDSRRSGAPYLNARDWQAQASLHDGSWWRAWGLWLRRVGGKEMVAAPARAGNAAFPPLDDAPGRYVLQR